MGHSGLLAYEQVNRVSKSFVIISHIVKMAITSAIRVGKEQARQEKAIDEN